MNVSKTYNCYGCGVCAVACGKNLISIEFNKEGFYEPVIHNMESCSSCGICMDVCSFNHKDYSLSENLSTAYAGWSLNPDVRKKSSSGGVGFELGRTIIGENGKVCAVRYNNKTGQVEHYVATTDVELTPSQGSKYIQSYTVDGFSEIVGFVRKCKKEGIETKVLVIGTPCQIDSLRRYTQLIRCESFFVFVDFFCHGVPSRLMWNKYVDFVKDKIGKVTHVSWRNKISNWHDSYAIAMNGERMNVGKQEKQFDWISKLSEGDMFYRLFLSDACLGKQCYDSCRFKWNRSSADIRIGDAWTPVFDDNDDGVSVVVAFTEKGLALLNKSNISKRVYPFDVVADRQMKKNASRPVFYNRIMKILKDDSCSIEVVYSKLVLYKRWSKLKAMLRHPRYAVKVLLKRK